MGRHSSVVRGKQASSRSPPGGGGGSTIKSVKYVCAVKSTLHRSKRLDNNFAGIAASQIKARAG